MMERNEQVIKDKRDHLIKLGCEVYDHIRDGTHVMDGERDAFWEWLKGGISALNWVLGHESTQAEKKAIEDMWLNAWNVAKAKGS